VSDDVFLLRIPLDLSSQAQGNIGQVAGGRHTVAGLDIGNRCRAGFDAVEEIPRVRSQQIVGRGLLQRFGPEPNPCFRLWVGSAGRMAEEARNLVLRVAFRVRNDTESAARDDQASLTSEDFESFARGTPAAGLAMRPQRRELR